ncbi:outer membrane efflux protein [Pseudopedobacter saltans DSM 12145]|uniref:Outer membrane efflux protein n=1 Tax=Pseudopedobacter saltans (strain ATCC 51119 / DSM 12145 / JCM 21818 / CCUG 39354 / LMG 10337 / NBRC 100064 / NCIMB 13643) TaxID=762903 RepID=F0SAR9_PSESL|nr:TolC family protein [Pseudopedobacter saltans]ADY53690.1 outer membrane efflux protein [Pseudopedobacter saltans DSM 12145]
MKIRYILANLLLLPLFLSKADAQVNQRQKLPEKATLNQLIDYALENRISVKQAEIDEEIGKKDIASALSGWFPQVSANGSYTHNIKIPTTFFNGQNLQMGQENTSALVLQADQQLLNPSLIQASKASKYIRQQNLQNTENVRINAVVDVSKAYYDILTSEEQIKIIQENITRLLKQYNDAKIRYETGLVDKTDFKRAQIALSNAKADEKRTVELRKYKYENLKQILGIGATENISLSFADKSMENEILLDTTKTLSYADRIEYQQLMTTKSLQKVNTQYQKSTFLPNLSAYYNYAWDFRSKSFNNLYDNSFPRSAAGLTLSLPIFQGTKRYQQIQKSKLQEERLDWDVINLENQINAQYSLAKATYSANLNDWKTSKENVELSKEVYNTIKLQYDEGIKTYLDLMTAEADLRTSQLNYLNNLYAVLSSKIDVQKALGTIVTQ